MENKTVVIRTLDIGGDKDLKYMKLPKEEILYIGDSKTDMQTGQNAGMDTIGVSWGFRGRKELEENHASYVVDHPEDILKFI